MKHLVSTRLPSLSGAGSTIIIAGLVALAACSAKDGDGDGSGRVLSGGSGGMGGAGAGGVVSVGGSVAGSGTAGIGGVIVGGGTGGTGGEETCGIQSFDLERKNPDLLFVLDRSASMQRNTADEDVEAGELSKWELTVPPLRTAVEETDAAVNSGLKTYPDQGEACSVESITDTIHVAVSAMNALEVLDTLDATTPDGNGTPTGAAIDAGVAHLLSLQTDNPKYILLASDGVPSCDDAGDEDTDGARAYAISAAAAAYAAGVPVFVVGVATTKETANESLNDVAVAGGVPRAGDPSYYLAESEQELLDALRAITGEIATCLFPLSSAPPVPDNIGVKINGRLVPRDTTHASGWDYTDAGYSGVEVFGADCEEIKTSAQNMVQILFGCPDQPIE